MATFIVDATIKISGCLYNRDTINCTYRQLKKVFGKPHFDALKYKNGDNKVTTQWYFKKSNKLFTIYDLKETSLYWEYDPDALAPTVRQLRKSTKPIEWRIGGTTDTKEFMEWVSNKMNLMTLLMVIVMMREYLPHSPR